MQKVSSYFSKIVGPSAFMAVIILVNKKAVMGEHTVSMRRNIMLVVALILSVSMTIIQLPNFIQILFH
jgi:Mn2+/Fe2+ NRAMP family transporter